MASSSLRSDRIMGANNRLRVGFIGVGGMGRGNLRDFLKCENVEVVAVSDVWQPNVERASEIVLRKAATYKDFRKVLERQDIDAGVISTPDHWHAYMMIQACMAGKDVYVEKPLAHSIPEGRQMVEAARKYSDSSGRHSAALRQTLQGSCGHGAFWKTREISRVAAWNYHNESPFGMGNFPDSEPPRGLDYDVAWSSPQAFV